MDVEDGKHVATRAVASGGHIFTTAIDMLRIAILSVFIIQRQCFESLLRLMPFYIPRYRNQRLCATGM